ncbi:metallophosphoesterase [Anopheles sinensis]|uniref:Metallophosphoesterase n=1 Tax=Anopheles sinensis TaxID=74873 RepID=A0A084WTQ1_ANOSI|nr:metallophosphoesterase [Anopheles sinensis]
MMTMRCRQRDSQEFPSCTIEKPPSPWLDLSPAPSTVHIHRSGNERPPNAGDNNDDDKFVVSFPHDGVRWITGGSCGTGANGDAWNILAATLLKPTQLLRAGRVGAHLEG